MHWKTLFISHGNLFQNTVRKKMFMVFTNKIAISRLPIYVGYYINYLETNTLMIVDAITNYI